MDIVVLTCIEFAIQSTNNLYSNIVEIRFMEALTKIYILHLLMQDKLILNY